MSGSALRAVFAETLTANPVARQRRLVEAFELSSGRTLFHPWHLGDPIPSGVFVVVAVSVGWSIYEQQLAIGLDEALAEGRTRDDLIAVLAADGLTTPSQVEAVFPGLRGLGQTPYLALWEDQALTLVDAGSSATAFLADRYGLVLP